MRRGFTLVELSIVLVIIGLLIGGILVAQSMIETARQARLLSTLEQITILTQLHKERFAQLPGDDNRAQSLFGAASCGDNCNGDGNGTILGSSGPTQFEGVRFWHHLKLGGILGDKIAISAPVDVVNASYNTSDYIISQYVPTFNGIDGQQLAIVAFGNPAAFTNGAPVARESCTQALFIGIPNLGSTVSTPGGMMSETSGVKNMHMRAIEAKIDDGAPLTGKIITGFISVKDCRNGTAYRNSPVNGYSVKDQECNFFYCMDK